MDQGEELWCDVRVHVNAAVATRDGPNGSSVKSVFRFKLNPVWHRIANVVISTPWRPGAFSNDNLTAFDPEPV